MALVQDDLGGHVLRSPTERPRLLTQTHLLSKAKVHLSEETEMINILRTYLSLFFSFNPALLYQLGVTSVVQDDVLRFEVSVDDASGVQEGQSLDDAAGVEAGGAVIERAPGRQRRDVRDLVRQMVVMMNND